MCIRDRILLLIVAVIYLGYRYVQARAQQRLAKHALSQLDLSQATAASQINQLLKQAAMAYYGRQHIAPLHGEQWQQFLQLCLGKKQQPLQPSWFNTSYQQQQDPQQAQQFYQYAQHWLNKALPAKRPLDQILPTINEAKS